MEAARYQQGRHEAEMAKVHHILIDLKAQVAAILVQRLVAATVVNDHRAQLVGNIDGSPKKRSTPIPEQAGGNGGGQIPPTTMHGAGDPDPDDGDDDDEGHDPKGGPSRKEKGKGPERQDEEEDV